MDTVLFPICKGEREAPGGVDDDVVRLPGHPLLGIDELLHAVEAVHRARRTGVPDAIAQEFVHVEGGERRHGPPETLIGVRAQTDEANTINPAGEGSVADDAVGSAIAWPRPLGLLSALVRGVVNLSADEAGAI